MFVYVCKHTKVKKSGGAPPKLRHTEIVSEAILRQTESDYRWYIYVREGESLMHQKLGKACSPTEQLTTSAKILVYFPWYVLVPTQASNAEVVY